MTAPAGHEQTAPAGRDRAAGAADGPFASLQQSLTPRRLAVAAAIVMFIVAAAAVGLLIRRAQADALAEAELTLASQAAIAATMLRQSPPATAAEAVAALRSTLLPGQAIALIDASGVPQVIAPTGAAAAQAFRATPAARLQTAATEIATVPLPGGAEALVATVGLGSGGATLGLSWATAAILWSWAAAWPLYLVLVLAPGAAALILVLLLFREMQRSDALAQGLWVRQSRFESAFAEVTLRAAEAEERLRDDLAGKAAQLAAAQDAAEEAQRVKGDLLAAASHELRTPLNAVIGFSEIMVSGVLGPLGHPKYEEYIRDIHSSGRQLLYAVDGLLAMARIERGTKGLRPEAADIAAIARDCAALIRPYADDKGVRIVGHTGRPPAVRADVSALRQSVMNVLVNAVQFTPPGGRVTVTCETGAEHVGLTIADTGLGIADPDLARLGAPFERANGSKGLGLGLAVARSLTELMDGQFAITSAPEEGTTVTLALPLAAAAAEPAEHENPAEETTAPLEADDEAEAQDAAAA